MALPQRERDPRDEAFLRTLGLARLGDAGALEELTTAFYDRVQGIVHQRLSHDLRVGRPWLASRFSTGDIVHEVFTSVIRDLDAFGGDTEDGFCGYLAMVVRNRIIDSIRHHQADRRDGRMGLSIRDDFDITSDDTAGDPAEVAARIEAVQLLERSLGSLEERERLLVRARYEGTATFQELARLLGYGSESTARRAYFDAMAELAVQLKDLRDGEAQ